MTNNGGTGEANQLFLGNGAGVFSRVTSGPAVSGGAPSTGVVRFDANGDGHDDLYVTNGGGANNQRFVGRGANKLASVCKTLVRFIETHQ